MRPHRVRSSHITRFSSGVGSTVFEIATAADNTGRTAGSGCGGGMGEGSLGGAGWPVRCAGGQRGGDRIALGIPKAVTGSPGRSGAGVGREEVEFIMDDEDETCGCDCVVGELNLGMLADNVKDGSCWRVLFELTLFKLVVRRSTLVLKFRGDST